MCSPEKKADRDGMLFWLVWSEKCYSTQRRILRKVEMYPCIYIYIIKKRFRVPPFWVPAKVKVCFHVRVRLLKLVNLQHNKTQCQHFFIFVKVGFNWIFMRSPSFCFKSKLQSYYTHRLLVYTSSKLHSFYFRLQSDNSFFAKFEYKHRWAYEMKAKCQRRRGNGKRSRTNLPNSSVISEYALKDNSTHRIVKFLQKGNIQLGTRVSWLSDKSLKQRKTI